MLSEVALSVSGVVERIQMPLGPLAVIRPVTLVMVWPEYGERYLLPLISAMVRAAASDCRLAKAQQKTGVVFMMGRVAITKQANQGLGTKERIKVVDAAAQHSSSLAWGTITGSSTQPAPRQHLIITRHGCNPSTCCATCGEMGEDRAGGRAVSCSRHFHAIPMGSGGLQPAKLSWASRSVAPVISRSVCNRDFQGSHRGRPGAQGPDWPVASARCSQTPA